MIPLTHTWSPTSSDVGASRYFFVGTFVFLSAPSTITVPGSRALITIGLAAVPLRGTVICS